MIDFHPPSVPPKYQSFNAASFRNFRLDPLASNHLFQLSIIVI
jgi:hypothetical protein